MSKKLIHPVFKKGHSNWLEASHTVFIRFRPKHINLERLHYVVSTELALLQSNMTYMHQRRGPQYHWVIELFRRMKLPVFDGVHQALESFNEVRKQMLEREKTEKFKTRRMQLKVARTKDAQCRKAWSNKHGHDTYGDDDSGDDQDDVELKPKASRKKASSGGKCKACGPLLTSALATRNAHSIKCLRVGLLNIAMTPCQQILIQYTLYLTKMKSPLMTSFSRLTVITVLKTSSLVTCVPVVLLAKHTKKAVL